MKYVDMLKPLDGLIYPKEITTHDIYLNLAFMLAKKSTCRRGYAGCVVTRNGRIISTGYNGSPPGALECLDFITCRIKGCVITQEESVSIVGMKKDYEIQTDGCFDSIHSEANAIGFCAKNGIATDGAVVYITKEPCKSCAQLLVSSGVKTVYYVEEYRNHDGLIYCQINGIEIIKAEACSR
jgi:dCMP deaminase